MSVPIRSLLQCTEPVQLAHFPAVAVSHRWRSPRCPPTGAAGGFWISRQHDCDRESKKSGFGSNGIRTTIISRGLTSAAPNRQNGAPKLPTCGGNCAVDGGEGWHLLVRGCDLKGPGECGLMAYSFEICPTAWMTHVVMFFKLEIGVCVWERISSEVMHLH